MVWQKGGRHTWQAWVVPVMGPRVACSTETGDRTHAEAMERWAKDISARHDARGVLAGIADRTITLAKAYHMGEAGAASYIAAARTDAKEAAKRVDVLPLLTEWTKQRSSGKKPVKTAEEQLRMVRHVFPESPMWSSLWTADEIDRRLADLKGKTWKGKARVMQDPTRNRYRSVISTAADFLTRKKVLTSNPVDAVQRFAENPLGFDYLELPDAKALVNALDTEGQIVAALALGFGMEWQAIAKAEVRDLDLSGWTAHARGGKTHWRDRVCPLSDVFAFLQPILTNAVRGKTPRALLVTAPEWRLLEQQKQTASAIGVKPITIHQWRHSCAVILLQAGELPANVAHLLGHKDSALVIKRYGRFIVRASHFVTRSQADSATQLSTATR